MMTNNTERVFTALADTTRRQLLITLAEASPKTATQLAKGFRITRQGVLKHLDVLEEAGLVYVQPKGREKRYSLTLDPLKDVNAFIAALGAKWEERLLRLKDLVESDESL
jgi:DNA-binding transcriptional ArsR family regulator